jgi:hypothetical protein
MKKSIINDSFMVAPPHSGPLSTAVFDPSKWEIMYPHFVEEALVDPPNRARG